MTAFTSQGLEGVLVNPGLDHDGDPVLLVHLKFRLMEPGINPRLLSGDGLKSFGMAGDVLLQQCQERCQCWIVVCWFSIDPLQHHLSVGATV